MKQNLYFKLTTIPDYSEKVVELYYKKYKESNSLETLEEAEKDFYKNAGKNPLFGKIYSITVGYVNENEIRITVLKGEEKGILTEFLNLCNSDHFKHHQICGWNFSFLLPFLRVRSAKNNVTANFHPDLIDLGRKPWTITGLCLYDFWKGVGWFNSSLEEVAELTFGINTNFVDGEDVFKHSRESNFERLDESSIEEVKTLINVHRGIKIEDQIDLFIYSVRILGEVKEEQVSLIERLNLSKTVSQKEKEEIFNILKKNKISKKEKEIVFDLIKASLCDLEPNFGSVRNEKQVNEIINQLKEEFENN